MGRFFAIPLIANAFAHLAMSGFVWSWQWVIFAVIAVVDGLGFWKMCLGENHKPDQGYPEAGKISWHGLSHLPYHGVFVAMSIFVIWHIFVGNLRGPVLYVALLGAMIYIVLFVADIRI